MKTNALATRSEAPRKRHCRKTGPPCERKRILFAKRLIAIAFLLPLPALAQFNALYNWTDFTVTPQTNRVMVMEPIWTYTIFGTNFTPGDRRQWRTDTNGMVTATNIIPGSYRIIFSGIYQTTTLTNTFTNGIAAGSTVNAWEHLGANTNVNALTTAYTREQSDTRFLGKTNGVGRGVTLHGTNQISSLVVGTNDPGTNAVRVVGNLKADRFEGDGSGITGISASGVSAGVSNQWRLDATNAAAAVTNGTMWLASSNVATPALVLPTNFIVVLTPPTNGSEGIKQSADWTNILIGVSSDGHRPGRWLFVPDRGGISFKDGGTIWGWASHSANGGELQINGSPNIAIQPSEGSAGQKSVVQLGPSNPIHDMWYFQYDDQPVATNDLGHSKSVGWAARAWDGGVARAAYPGIAGKTAGTNVATIGGIPRPHNTELWFYGHVPEWSTFSTHIPPNAVDESHWRGIMHSNGWTLVGRFVVTNSLIASSPIVSISNGASRFEGYMTVIPKDANVSGGDLEVDTANKLVLIGRISSTAGDASTMRIRDRFGTATHQLGNLGNYINGALAINKNAAATAPYEFEVRGDAGMGTLVVTNTATAGTFVLTAGPIWTNHNATPEGAITAPQGSLCTVTVDDIVGLYVKTNGTGNTGWGAK